MDPIRQAAILVAALDIDAADALLDQMPDDFAAAVRNQVMELDHVDSAEEQAVIGKFLGNEPVAAGDSLELSDGASADSVALTLEDYLTRVESEVEVRTPFDFLKQAEEKTLRKLLQQEQPQTIALVLSHVESELAAGVLSELPREIQVDVARRMVELEAVDAHTLSEIEDGLHSLYRSQVDDEGRHVGWNAMRKIVASVDESKSDLLKNLQRADAKLAGQLAIAPAAPPQQQQEPRSRSNSTHTATLVHIEFSDLEVLNDTDLGKVLQRADGRTLLLALAGASPAFIIKVYGQLPRDDARALRRQIEQQGTIRLRDVEEAQRRIARVAAKLAVAGEIKAPHGRPLVMAA